MSRQKGWKTLIDLTGQRFGKLLVIMRDLKYYNKSQWLCKCDCGNELSIRGSHLRDGQKQCKKCQPHNYNIKHGLDGHPSHATWAMMKQRCENANATGYHNYGGRGIRVCERWQKFEYFVEDMGIAPKGHTLDRIDNDGNYCKENCRWATISEQKSNTRFNRYLTLNGETHSVAEWAKKIGISSSVIFSRIEFGWKVEDILSSKKRCVERKLEFNGHSLTVKEWSKKLNISKRTINTRFYKGLPLNIVLSKEKLKTGKKCQQK